MNHKFQRVSAGLLAALVCVVPSAHSQTAFAPSGHSSAEFSQAWASLAGPDALLVMFSGVAGEPMFAPAKSQSYLGVDLRDVGEDELSALKIKEARGAEIITVDHDGPAGKVGLRERDVVVQMNGQQIEGEEQLRRMLRETPAGRAVVLVISRDGQQQTITVQLANRADVERQAWEQHFSVPDPQTSAASQADSQPIVAASPGFVSRGSGAGPSIPAGHGSSFLPMLSFRSAYTGAMLDSLGPQLASYFGAKPGTGLLVKSVDANSPAASAGLKAGDVVVKVNAVEVAQPNDWLRPMRDNKGKPVQVTVLRNKQEQNLSVTPGAPKKK